jgi:hypothetical protein
VQVSEDFSKILKESLERKCEKKVLREGLMILEI